jgi:LPXTG-motif cell wall-anchored protein
MHRSTTKTLVRRLFLFPVFPWPRIANAERHGVGAPDSSASTPTATSTPSITSSVHASSHTGAIAGGVGGVAGVGLLAFLGYILVRRKKSRKTYLPKAKSINGEKVDLVGSQSPPPPPTPVPTYTSRAPMKLYVSYSLAMTLYASGIA